MLDLGDYNADQGGLLAAPSNAELTGALERAKQRSSASGSVLS
jgi:hypothetical protein